MSSRIERRYDIDWLRFFAMCAVFLFHCARFFDDGDWHVKNAQASFEMTVFTNVLAQWIMPIFFVLSGVSTYYSLVTKQKNFLYLWERFKRLIVPLVFAIFTMIPLQVYYERVSHSQFSGAILDFYPHYFDGLYGFGGNFAWMGLHLWYLLFLFIFTLLAFPLFKFLRKPGGKQLIARMADFLTKPGAVFLLFIFVTALDFGLMPHTLAGIRNMGGWNLLTYLLLFVYGYIFAGDIRFKETIQVLERWLCFMRENKKKVFEDLLIRLAENRANYKEHALTGLFAMKGENWNGELMVIGRSVNGWDVAWEPDMGQDVLKRKKILNRLFKLSEDEPMNWVMKSWGNKDKKGYNTKKSAFWRVIKKVSEQIAVTDTEMGNWPSYLVWSNLKKIQLR